MADSESREIISIHPNRLKSVLRFIPSVFTRLIWNGSEAAAGWLLTLLTMSKSGRPRRFSTMYVYPVEKTISGFLLKAAVVFFGCVSLQFFDSSCRGSTRSLPRKPLQISRWLWTVLRLFWQRSTLPTSVMYV